MDPGQLYIYRLVLQIWCYITHQLISDVIFLYQLAQVRPHNVLHFLEICMKRVGVRYVKENNSWLRFVIYKCIGDLLACYSFVRLNSLSHICALQQTYVPQQGWDNILRGIRLDYCEASSVVNILMLICRNKLPNNRIILFAKFSSYTVCGWVLPPWSPCIHLTSVTFPGTSFFVPLFCCAVLFQHRCYEMKLRGSTFVSKTLTALLPCHLCH